ncbi:MAG: rod-binding protein [Desulfobulbaceae bacterium]|nr:rod-binding protein [Desulfobulbaceae bacterium]
MGNISPAAFQFQESLQSVDKMKEKQFTDKVENKKLKEACEDFEAILLNKILSSMREMIPEGGLFEKSYGEKIYQSMLDEEMTKQMAHGKGIGLSELLYEQLSAFDTTKHPVNGDSQNE